MEWLGVALSVICEERCQSIRRKWEKPPPVLGSLNITIVCLVADLRHMRTNGDTHDSFDTQHAMTSDFNVKISRSPKKDAASTHSA